MIEPVHGLGEVDGMCGIEAAGGAQAMRLIDIPPEHAGFIEVNAAFFRKNKAAVGPVSFETAWAMIRAAHEYAELFGLSVSAAVVDEAAAVLVVVAGA